MNTVKSNNGVVCYLNDIDDSTIRVVLDDVVALEGPDSNQWKRYVLYTHKDYNKKEIEDLTFTEKEMADFGFAVMARLIALRNHPIKS